MRRILRLALLLCLASAIAANAQGTDLFDIKPMADGVYAAIAKPAYKVNCNAAIILLGDSVLVVVHIRNLPPRAPSSSRSKS